MLQFYSGAAPPISCAVDIKDRLAATGVEPTPLDTAAFTAHLKQQRETFREVIQANNIRLD